MITLVTGQNEYAIKEHANGLIAQFKREHGEEGIIKRRGEDVERKDIPDLFGGASLFSAQQLVIIDQPSASQELTDYLSEQADSIPSDIGVVFLEPKPDKRTKWYKTLQKHGKIVEKQPLKPHEAAKWVATTVKQRGGTIAAKDAAYLVGRVGHDQWQLHNEINKLLSANTTIQQRTIDELVEPTLDETIFQLLDAAVQGQHVTAVDMYENLSQRDLDPFQTVAMLGWQVHNMLLVKANIDMRDNELAGKAGMAPFVVQKTKRLVRSMQLVQIKQLIDLVLAAERDLKTTGMDGHRRTRHLIYQIAKATTS